MKQPTFKTPVTGKKMKLRKLKYLIKQYFENRFIKENTRIQLYLDDVNISNSPQHVVIP